LGEGWHELKVKNVDVIAHADHPIAQDVRPQAAAVGEGLQQRFAGYFVQVGTRRAEADAFDEHAADAEALSDEVIESHALGDEVSLSISVSSRPGPFGSQSVKVPQPSK
jgi:hypothetical protein